MKKALYLTMVIALILASAFTFSSCRQTENSNGSNDEPPTNTTVGIADISQSEVEIDGKSYNRFTFTFTDGSVKSFDVEIPKGADGSAGEDGEDGKDGKDGVTPKFKLENGILYVSYDNGSTGGFT